MKRTLLLSILLIFSLGADAQIIKPGKMVQVNVAKGVTAVRVAEDFYTLPGVIEEKGPRGLLFATTKVDPKLELIPGHDVSVIHAREEGTKRAIQLVVLSAHGVKKGLTRVVEKGVNEIYYFGVKASPKELELLGVPGLKLEKDMYLLVGLSHKRPMGNVGLVVIYETAKYPADNYAAKVDTALRGSGLVIEASMLYKREPKNVQKATAAFKRFLSLKKFQFLEIRSKVAVEDDGNSDWDILDDLDSKSKKKKKEGVVPDGFVESSGPGS
jgi:hypothetical protein